MLKQGIQMKNYFFTILFSQLFTGISLFTITIDPKQNFFTQLKNNHLWHEGQPLKLHLGCGESHLDGYINIDYPLSEHTIQSQSAADIFGDITLLNLPANSIHEIRLHHVFEHFDRQTALALLCNWHQALQINGILTIETPDFEENAKLILLSKSLSYEEKQVILRHIFGSHEAHWAIHCDGWYKEKYLHVLPLLGFEDITLTPSRYLNLCNITIKARKNKVIDKKLLINKAKEILRESLVADCEIKMFQVWSEKLENLTTSNN